jgi:integrase
MASIVDKKLSDGSRAYLVRFRTPDGAQRSKQFRRKKDAEAFVNLIEVDRLRGTVIDPRLGRLSLSDWWAQWWPTVTDLRRTTYARDEQYFRTHVEPWFGSTQLGRIDRTEIRRWITWMVTDPAEGGAGKAPATVQKAFQVFNKALRAAVEDRLIPFNPAADLPLPRIEREEMRCLTVDEVWRLADEIDPRYRSFVLLGAYGGLRLGEMNALRWGRVNLLQRTVQVRATLTDVRGHLQFGPPKTRAAHREVSVPGFVCDELAMRAAGPAATDDLVFTAPEGGPVRASLFRRRIWNPAVQRAELGHVRIHDLRHTAVSLWIAAGANPKQVAVRAGHTSVSVVLDRYGHLYPKHDDALVDALERGRPAQRSTG